MWKHRSGGVPASLRTSCTYGDSLHGCPASLRTSCTKVEVSEQGSPRFIAHVLHVAYASDCGLTLLVAQESFKPIPCHPPRTATFHAFHSRPGASLRSLRPPFPSASMGTQQASAPAWAKKIPGEAGEGGYARYGEAQGKLFFLKKSLDFARLNSANEPPHHLDAAAVGIQASMRRSLKGTDAFVSLDWPKLIRTSSSPDSCRTSSSDDRPTPSRGWKRPRRRCRRHQSRWSWYPYPW